MTQTKDQKRQEHLLDWRKAIEAADPEISELDDANVRRYWETKLREISLPKKDYLPKVPEQFESFIFADDKSVAAVNGTAENKENQSVQTQN